MMASRSAGRTAITPRQRLGARLRGLRELAGQRNEDLAVELGLSPATVSRIEAGDRLIKTREIEVWVRATGAPDGVRAELATLAEAAVNQIASWQARVEQGADVAQVETAALETSAATILGYDHAVVPGLLQVRDYARLVFQLADVGTGDIPGKY
jgi:transcriptional regulator with XRE-family HTH domain